MSVQASPASQRGPRAIIWKSLPLALRRRLAPAVLRVAFACLPREVQELATTQNRLAATASLRRWLERRPRRLRRFFAARTIGMLSGGKLLLAREVFVAAEIQLLWQAGKRDAALRRLNEEPDEVRLARLPRLLLRAIEMAKSRPDVPGYIDQLLGGEGNYFAGRFCSKPFGDFEIGSDGGVHVCCPNYLPMPIGRADGADATLAGLVNSDMARRLRKSILDQSFAYCDWTQCNAIQLDTLPLRKDVAEPRLKRFIAAGDGVIDGPTDVRLSHDPTCNLWCPSCRTHRITAKGDEFARIMTMTERVVVPALRTAKTVMMNGYGDVFSSRSCRRTLESISDALNPDLELIFITNGVLFSEAEWAKFPNIHRRVRTVRVSIDASRPETYKRVRLGGDWDKLVANLDFLARLRRENVIRTFLISFVVQQANFTEMAEFYRWGRTLGCDNVIFEHLMDWGTRDEHGYRRCAVHLPDNPDYPAYVAAARALKKAAAGGRVSFDRAFP
ncbi:MAG TPA: hypothetical protein VKX28_26805 [Xanthobacteraceae bacterium]|nr:hypothetical protein [Xanthobacteraceae bacterium]